MFRHDRSASSRENASLRCALSPRRTGGGTPYQSRWPPRVTRESVLARPARHHDRAGCLNLPPNPPPNLVGFGDDAVFVHRQNLTIAHDELTVDHAGLDVGRLTIVNPRGHDAPRRYEVGPLSVQDKEVCLFPNIDRAEKPSLLHRE